MEAGVCPSAPPLRWASGSCCPPPLSRTARTEEFGPIMCREPNPERSDSGYKYRSGRKPKACFPAFEPLSDHLPCVGAHQRMLAPHKQQVALSHGAVVRPPEKINELVRKESARGHPGHRFVHQHHF